MRMPLHGRTVALLIGSLLVVQWSMDAQSKPATSKRPLTYDVIDYWKSIGGTRLSDDGQWVSYSVTSQAEDGELIVRNLKTSQEFKHPRGTGAQFTSDGKFVIFTIAQSKADEERERLQNRGRGAAGGEGAEAPAGGTTPPATQEPPATPPATRPATTAAGPGGRQGGGRQGGAGAARDTRPRTGLGIMSLADGKVVTVDRVGSFKLAEENPTWLAYYKGGGGGGAGAGGRGGRGAGAPPAAAPAGRGAAGAANARERKQPGADLVLRNMATAEETTIPEVTEYFWNPKGTLLAYAVSSNDATKDGAFLRNMRDGNVTTLHAGRGRYRSLAFDEAGTQITFLSDQVDFAKPVAPYRVYYWKSGDARATELISADTAGMPQGMVVADNAAPRFSRDGGRIFLATAPPPPPPPPADGEAEGDTPTPIPVDLWSARDPWLQPMQRVRANQERTRNYRAVFHLDDKKFVQLATPDLPTVNPGDDLARAIGMTDLPYRMEASWDQSYNDVFLLDLKTGKPSRILEHWGSGGTTMSPGGKYVLYFDESNGHWFTYRVADGTRANLTEKVKVRFQQDNDTPDLPGSYGTAGWTANDASVLLYDQFDIWEVKPDGTGARNVTSGAGRSANVALRYRSMDPEERVVPPNKPLLLSATDDRTRATGYYRLASLTTTAPPEKVVMLDKAFGAVNKAKNADTVVFTLSRFEEFPDLWTSSDLSFKDMKKISNVGVQQDQFTWGKSELIEYINADGQKLRAILTKPDDFDPKKKYPLMVYIYEELTQGLHSYSAPNVGTSINIPRYVSNGYIMLRPDIVYTTGYPGEAAEKCVIPAVNTVVAQGYVDEKRIGIQGHSWGGYQITHLITRTNMFAAVQAGASVSNMISAYGGIRWDSGMSRAFQYEKTQSRIGAPPWDAPLQFIENSPIFWVKKINTPYLTIHNDEDGAVPWEQGIEFISALRRLGKEGYMFNYNGQRHGLSNRDYMKHWTVHMDEFFDHYLLGKPRPEWMDKGVPFLERGKRDVAPMFKKKGETTTPAAQALK